MAVVCADGVTSINAWESNLLGQMVDYLTSKEVIQLIHTGNSLLTHKLATCTKRFCIDLAQSVKRISLDSLLALIAENFPNLTHLALYGTNSDKMQCCFIESPFALPKSLTTLKLNGIQLRVGTFSSFQGFVLPNLTSLSLKSFELAEMCVEQSLTDFISRHSISLLYLHIKPNMSLKQRTDVVKYKGLEGRPLPLTAEFLRIPQKCLVGPMPSTLTRLVIYETAPVLEAFPPIPHTITDLTLKRLFGTSHMDILLSNVGINPCLKRLRLVQSSSHTTINQTMFDCIGLQFPSLTTLLVDLAIPFDIDMSVLPKSLICLSSHFSFIPSHWCHLNKDVQFNPASYSDLVQTYPFHQTDGRHYITPQLWSLYSPYMPNNLQAIWLKDSIPEELSHCHSIVVVGLIVMSEMDRKTWFKYLSHLPASVRSLHIHISHSECCMPWFDTVARSRLRQLDTITLRTSVWILDEPLTQWCWHLPQSIRTLYIFLSNTFFSVPNPLLCLPPLRKLCRDAVLTEFKLVAPNYHIKDTFMYDVPESIQHATIVASPVYRHEERRKKLDEDAHIKFLGNGVTFWDTMSYRRDTSKPFKM